MADMRIIPLDDEFRNAVNEYVKEEWGGPMMVSLGHLYDTSDLPGFVVVEEDEMRGAALYRIDDRGCEVAGLFSLVPGQGIGTKLLDKIAEEAKRFGCARVGLVTTNDNTAAIRYYQRYGFALKAVHIDSMDLVRKYKPGVPLTGIDGIPLAHQFEFEIKP